MKLGNQMEKIHPTPALYVVCKICGINSTIYTTATISNVCKTSLLLKMNDHHHHQKTATITSALVTP